MSASALLASQRIPEPFRRVVVVLHIDSVGPAAGVEALALVAFPVRPKDGD
jgi:hypothetical protein